MEIEFKESDINRTIKVMVKSVLIFSIFFSSFFSIVQIFLGNILIAVLVIPLSVISFLINKRIATIRLVGKD